MQEALLPIEEALWPMYRLPLTDTGGALIDTGGPLYDTAGPLSAIGSPPADTGCPLDPQMRPSGQNKEALAGMMSLVYTENSRADIGGSLVDIRSPLHYVGGPMTNIVGLLTDVGRPLAETENPLDYIRRHLNDV